MNSVERVPTALKLGQPDRVPVLEFVVDEKVARAAVPGCVDVADCMDRLDHPDVREALQAILDACRRQKVAAGIHVAAVDPQEVHRRVQAGFRFVACGIDTLFIREGCRQMLKQGKGPDP